VRLLLILRSALVWDITQRRVVIPYRRFGATYQSHLQESRSHFLLGLLDPWRWDQCVVPKRRYRTTTQSCVISQKSADLIYMAAEAWNHWYWFHLFMTPVILFFPHKCAEMFYVLFKDCVLKNFYFIFAPQKVQGFRENLYSVTRVEQVLRVWRPLDYSERTLFDPEDEGNTSLRNASNFTSRHGVTPQNTYIYSNNAVRTLNLALYWQCFFQGQHEKLHSSNAVLLLAQYFRYATAASLTLLPLRIPLRYVTSESYAALSSLNVSFILQQLSAEASPCAARLVRGLCGEGQVHSRVQSYSGRVVC
jgi:hypothetical protein